MKSSFVILLTLFSLVLFSACSGIELTTSVKDNSASNPAMTMEDSEMMEDNMMEEEITLDGEIEVEETDNTPSSPTTELTLEMSADGFNEDTITVEAGQIVTIMLENTGNENHDFVLEKTNIRSSVVIAGQTEKLEFVAPPVGEYTYFSSVENDRKNGMTGKLIVK